MSREGLPMAGCSGVGALLDIGYSLGGRLILLLPLAFCIFLLIDSQDRLVRLGAIVALILLEQMREWLLISGIRDAGSRKAEGGRRRTAHESPLRGKKPAK